MSAFGFVEVEKAVFPITTMCRVLGVSASGYHAWCRRPPSARAVSDQRLIELIRAIHVRSRGTYGVPRVHAELLFDHDLRVGRKRVARLMRSAGLEGVHRRRGTRTTRRDRDAAPAPVLVQRQFRPTAPDRLWVADITYIPTWSGLPVSGRGGRRLEPTAGGLEHGRPPAHRAGARRAGDGHRASVADDGHSLPFRSRHAA